MNYSEDLKRVAKRVVWFKAPEETLGDPKLFLAHLMTYGTLDDIATGMKRTSFTPAPKEPLRGETKCRA